MIVIFLVFFSALVRPSSLCNQIDKFMVFFYDGIGNYMHHSQFKGP